MTAQRPLRNFEDLVIGETRISSERVITEQELLDFARTYDPQWFHTDPEAAKSSAFGGLIASGIHVAALWRQMDHEINNDVNWVCGLGWDDVRWKKPVRPGDKLRATSVCIEKRESKSKPGQGIATYRYTMLNADDEEVFSCISINLVYRA